MPPCYPVSRADDLVYATPGGKPLLADLYLPHPEDTSSPLPVILWLHSGGWIAGDRHRSPDLVRFFAQRGFAMASIDYRLSREAIYPAALHDVIAAIHWLRDVAGTYNLDPQRIGLWGASAGGHLAALASLSAPETKIKAVVAAYPPTDFLQMPPSPQNYEGRFLGLPRGVPITTVPDLVRETNPATYAHPGAPPFLLLHGLNDTEVPPQQSELLCEALRAHDNDVTLSLVEGLGHSFLEEKDFGQWPAGGHKSTFGAIETFFRRHL